MARPSVADDSRKFLSALRRVDSIGNARLREVLGWTEARYWSVHEYLFEKGKIVKGRGRGGSVSLA
jgi:hypothetical protein